MFQYNLKESRESYNIANLAKPIIVSMESIAPLKEAHCVSDDGRLWDIPLMYFDECSRNLNMYPAEDTIRSFKESTFVNENLRNNTWYGEYEHPSADSPLSRFMFIEPTRYAWNILDMNILNDHIQGKVGLAAPLGTSIILPNLNSFGCNYAASCRISTPNYVVKDGGNGKKIFVKKYRMFPITFDCVTTPGISKCRLVRDGMYKKEPVSLNSVASAELKVKVAGSLGSESASAMVCEFTNPVNEIVKMIKSQESAMILEDMFNVDFSAESTNAMLINGGETIRFNNTLGQKVDMALNGHILNEVLRRK